MRVNAFDDDSGSFFVRVNGGEQHNLWSIFAELADRWHVVYAEADPAACLCYIERTGTDIRPKSLRERVAAGRPADK